MTRTDLVLSDLIDKQCPSYVRSTRTIGFKPCDLGCELAVELVIRLVSLHHMVSLGSYFMGSGRGTDSRFHESSEFCGQIEAV